MPLHYVTYGQQVIDNLKNNLDIRPEDHVALAQALCAGADNIGQAKAIAKALASPAQLDEVLAAMSFKEVADLAARGRQKFQDAVLDLRLARLRDVSGEIISFLPLSTQAQINKAFRARVNRLRTGGVTDTLYPHITKTPARLDYGRDKRCIVCRDAERHLPMLRESPQTRAMASMLAQRILSAHTAKRRVLRPDGPGKVRGYMLGVLRVGATVYIAISGSVLPDHLPALVTESGFGTFVHDAPPHTTAGGAAIDDVYMAQSDGFSPAEPFMCAAPKLVAVARAAVMAGQSWSMTEMWCGPPTDLRKDAHAYPSCSNCIDILPMMLCMRKPIARVQGGFKLVVNTRKGEKDVRAGRSFDKGPKGK